MTIALRPEVDPKFLAHDRYTVLGAGKSGQGSARLLRALGKAATLCDDRPESLPEADRTALQAEGIAVILGREAVAVHAASGTFDAVVVSPGVPGTHPLLVAAAGAGKSVLGEVEFGWLCSGTSTHVAITGTNGKTTVTMLMERLLADAGRDAIAAGNIGYALADAVREHVDRLDALTFSLECSSFQLETIEQFRPQAAVLLNITPDHLDRYDGMAGYAAAKARITAMQGPGDVFVINQDDPACLAVAAQSRARVRRFSLERPVEDGAWLDGDLIQISEPGRKTRRLLAMDELGMIGLHNVANAMAAACVCDALGIDIKSIAATLRAFRAAPHRMELVGEIAGVQYINDSKATNIDAMVRAIESFPAGIHLIAGGRDKNSPFAQVAGALQGRVRRAYLIGEAADDMLTAWGEATECVMSGTLEAALEMAQATATEGEIVLLSPACASFDQFRSYTHRGDVFKQWVRERVEPTTEDISAGSAQPSS